MSEITKVTSSHMSRIAIVYVRQSSATQVEHNRESTARQYALKQRAELLGWSANRIVIIDDDLGLSGATAHQRNGFARMAAEVALGHVGIVLGL
jgi:DNA invertase Pin-like site-specific DNA recombinase